MAKFFSSAKAANTAANNFASYLLPPPQDEEGSGNETDDNNNNTATKAKASAPAVLETAIVTTTTQNNNVEKYGDENAKPGEGEGPISPAYSLRSDLDILSLPPPVPVAQQQKGTTDKASNGRSKSRGKNRGEAEPMTALENGADTNHKTRSQARTKESKILSPQPKKMRSPSPNDNANGRQQKNKNKTETTSTLTPNRLPPRPMNAATTPSPSTLREVNRIPKGVTSPPLAPSSAGKTKKVMVRRRFSKSGNEHENDEEDGASVESSRSHRSTASGSNRARGRGWGRSRSRTRASSQQQRRASFASDSIVTANTGGYSGGYRRTNSKSGALPSKPKFSSLRKEGTFMEKLFGDVRRDAGDCEDHPLLHHPSNDYDLPPIAGSPSAGSPDKAQVPPRLMQLTKTQYSRRLVTSSIYHNAHTNLWIVTVDTTAKSNAGHPPFATMPFISSHNNNTLRAFSFDTQDEAREAAYAYSPPLKIPFEEQPTCQLCRAKFAVFRRPAHCRNCGVCICHNDRCRTSWSAKRVPETYHNAHSKAGDKPRRIKVCLDCHFLAHSFRTALLQGNEEEALDVYETGNINLRCPLGKEKEKDKKDNFFMSSQPQYSASNGSTIGASASGNHKSLYGETMFPVHCAAQGGNLTLLKWLVEVHYCAIFMTHTGTGHYNNARRLPLLTSKGRSVLQIALQQQNTEMVRYLAVEQGMSLVESPDILKDISLVTALMNLDLALRSMSASSSCGINGGASCVAGHGQESHADEDDYSVLGDPDEERRERESNGVIRGDGDSDAGNPHETQQLVPFSKHSHIKNINNGPAAGNENARAGGLSERMASTRGFQFGNVIITSSIDVDDDNEDGGEDVEVDEEGHIKPPPPLSLDLNGHGRHKRDNSNVDYSNPYAYVDEDEDEDSDLLDENFDDGIDSDDDATVTTVHDACILCNGRTIDCVMTPCGHQLCCMSCGKARDMCPICNTKCTALPIFRP